MQFIHSPFIKKFCLALTAAVLILCIFSFHHHAAAILDWINTLGLWAPVFFLLLYCLASILFLPTLALTLAGGALFGPILGTLINLFGATLGAACAFSISRHMIFDWLISKQNTRVNILIAGVDRQGWQFVAILRLMPVVPFSFVNYGLGITRIKFSHYLIATAIFLIPVEIAFTYCGYIGMDILAHPESFYKSTSLILLICLVFLLILYIRLRRHREHLS